MKLVVDASVALRWYVDSDLTGKAIVLLETEHSLIAPDLLVAEVTNAAWKLVRVGQISKEHGARIVEAAPSAFSALIDSECLWTRAFQIACELDHPVYDCLYLALAESERCELIVADQKFVRKTRGTTWEELVDPL